MQPNNEIKLPDDLPDNYPRHNLLSAEPKHYFAIIEDKQRWTIAREKISQPRHKVVEWLETLPEHVREDMRRRLNEIRNSCD